LWIEYRYPIGRDLFVLSVPGVIVHQQNGNGTARLNMQPTTGPALPAGATWVNPLGVRKITVNWANSTGASITIASASS